MVNSSPPGFSGSLIQIYCKFWSSLSFILLGSKGINILVGLFASQDFLLLILILFPHFLLPGIGGREKCPGICISVGKRSWEPAWLCRGTSGVEFVYLPQNPLAEHNWGYRIESWWFCRSEILLGAPKKLHRGVS